MSNSFFQSEVNSSVERLTELVSKWEAGPRVLDRAVRIWLKDLAELLECANEADAKLLHTLLARILDQDGAEALHQASGALSRHHFSETVEQLMGLCENLRAEDPIAELREAIARLRGETGAELRRVINEFDAASDPSDREKYAAQAWAIYFGA